MGATEKKIIGGPNRGFAAMAKRRNATTRAYNEGLSKLLGGPYPLIPYRAHVLKCPIPDSQSSVVSDCSIRLC